MKRAKRAEVAELYLPFIDHEHFLKEVYQGAVVQVTTKIRGKKNKVCIKKLKITFSTERSSLCLSTILTKSFFKSASVLVLSVNKANTAWSKHCPGTISAVLS